MVFTQGPLSLGESFAHERRNASVTFFADGDSGTPSISVQAANLWYDVRDTYIVRFVVDGCRKNLPLAAPNRMNVSGLSNQWKTRDGLFDSFVAHLSAHSSPILHERTAAAWRLLESLESLDGSDVWVGTSHNQMNFLSRDTTPVSYTHLTLPTIYSV